MPLPPWCPPRVHAGCADREHRGSPCWAPYDISAARRARSASRCRGRHEGLAELVQDEARHEVDVAHRAAPRRPSVALIIPRVRLLISVTDAAEAVDAAGAGADIIDVKDPGAGSLGR